NRGSGGVARRTAGPFLPSGRPSDPADSTPPGGPGRSRPGASGPGARQNRGMRTHAFPLRCAFAGAFLPPSCTAPAPYHLPAEGALGPYSAAVSSGDFVFLSGKIGKAAGGGGIGQEVDAAIDAIVKDLDRLHLTLADVVSVNVFVTDI